ncbi:hypothetical protein JRI60_17730 [Archangium violaceum]|uniref:hypothetical protein n=1 Tax=Archangium violaceum TaxID=83451 RepID=UPI001951E54F|nr:hypothetical protein [Archangium violaceum]QRO00734.1 hypothetical protein JRI60_17730 [Archangium violaceum]
MALMDMMAGVSTRLMVTQLVGFTMFTVLSLLNLLLNAADAVEAADPSRQARIVVGARRWADGRLDNSP